MCSPVSPTATKRPVSARCRPGIEFTSGMWVSRNWRSKASGSSGRVYRTTSLIVMPGTLRRLLAAFSLLVAHPSLPVGDGQVEGPGEGEAGEQAGQEEQPRARDAPAPAVHYRDQRQDDHVGEGVVL